jgi:hypothetical protein
MGADQVPSTCQRCAGPLEPGYVLEIGDGNVRSVSQWVTGAPERGFMFGLKTRNRRSLPITTFRCTQCGFLQSFAHPAAAGGEAPG